MGSAIGSGCRRWGFTAFSTLAVVLFLVRAGAYGDHLEVDGDILNGVDQGDCVEGSGATAVDVEPLELDWASLFNADGSVKPLPPNGVIAMFVADDLAVKGNKDCTSFARRNKNGDPLNTWESPGEGPPKKNDFSNAYAYLALEDGTGDRLLYIGVERLSNNGDSHVDFDVKQDAAITCRDCDNPGFFTGEHKEGDLLIAVDYERGGANPQLRIFEYLDAAGTLQILVDQAVPSLVACTVDDPGTPQDETDIICAGVNTKTIDGGPWQNYDDQGNPVDCIEELTFTEVCVNLTRLGDLTGITLSEERCVQTILAKSRTSQSISSELKDFVCIPFDTCSDISGYKYEVPSPGCGEVFDGGCGEGPDGVLGTEDDEITPLVNWQIALLDSDGELVTTDGNGDPLDNPTCTDSEGRYEFADVPNGEEYTVCEMLPDRLTVDEGAEEDLNCNGITGEPEENFIWLPCLPDPTADGELTGLASGSLDCCDTNGGSQYCYADPFELTEDEQRDFRNYKLPLCVDLTGIKFCDVDGDGTLDAEDYGLEGFCIVLKDDTGAVIDVAETDSEGLYSFGDVPCAASYTIEEDLSGSECSSADVSADWVQTSPAGGQHMVDVPCDVTAVAGLDFGNASVPSITCNATDQDLTNDAGLCSAQFCFTPTAENACGDPIIECTAEGPDGPVTLSVNPDTGEVCGDFPAGCPAVTTVTCTVTTAATANIPELTDSCSFTVTVTDDEAPEITCPDDAMFECDEDIVFGMATATDNCDPDPEITYVDNETPGDCPQEKTIVRTWTATDTCGNSSSCDQTITVVDTTAPEITNCPGDQEVDCDEPFEFKLMVEDNCDPEPSLDCSYTDDADPDRFTVEELEDGTVRLTLTDTTVVTVTCVATDACGNESDACTFTVSATCVQQACSPGFWKNNLSSWCDTGLYPEDGSCGDPDSDATLFKDAFMITDFSSTEIPGGFDQNLTLLEAVNMTGGNFNQTLFHGSAALLSSLSPDVSFPASPNELKSVMQNAFSGEITFADAAAYFKALNDAEQEGGCPLSGG